MYFPLKENDQNYTTLRAGTAFRLTKVYYKTNMVMAKQHSSIIIDTSKYQVDDMIHLWKSCLFLLCKVLFDNQYNLPVSILVVFVYYT